MKQNVVWHGHIRNRIDEQQQWRHERFVSTLQWILSPTQLAYMHMRSCHHQSTKPTSFKSWFNLLTNILDNICPTSCFRLNLWFYFYQYTSIFSGVLFHPTTEGVLSDITWHWLQLHFITLVSNKQNDQNGCGWIAIHFLMPTLTFALHLTPTFGLIWAR